MNTRRLLLSPLCLLIALITVIGLAAPSAAATGGLETRVRAIEHVSADAVGQFSGERPASVGCVGPETAGMAVGSCVATEAAGTGGVGPVLQGQAGVERSVLAAEARGETVIGREVTIETSAGRTRPDLVVRDAQGNLKFIESKCGPSACLTPNQRAGFPLIESSGGIPRGANAGLAGLPPGQPIGPTPVQVDWWLP